MATDYPTFAPFPSKPNHRFQNLTNRRFGQLVVIGFGGRRPAGKQLPTFWWAKCDCGEFKLVRASDLTHGKTKSCGCGEEKWRETFGTRNVSHGQNRVGKRTRLYRIWANMVSRCHSPANPQYRDYGGRGIAVCERWHEFANFFADMGQPPTDRHSIDRFPNNDGNYEPGKRALGDFPRAKPEQSARHKFNL